MSVPLMQQPLSRVPPPVLAEAFRATHDAFVACVIRKRAASRVAFLLTGTGSARLCGDLAVAYHDASQVFAEACRHLDAGRERQARAALVRMADTDRWPFGAATRAERVLDLLPS